MERNGKWYKVITVHPHLYPEPWMKTQQMLCPFLPQFSLWFLKMKKTPNKEVMSQSIKSFNTPPPSPAHPGNPPGIWKRLFWWNFPTTGQKKVLKCPCFESIGASQVYYISYSRIRNFTPLQYSPHELNIIVSLTFPVLLMFILSFLFNCFNLLFFDCHYTKKYIYKPSLLHIKRQMYLFKYVSTFQIFNNSFLLLQLFLQFFKLLLCNKMYLVNFFQ